jgi:hypothetical protein
MSGGGVEFVNEGSGLIALGTDNALYLYIVSGGNVGVGTGTPAFDLDVSGNINASTSFYCGSTAGVSSGGAIAVYNDGSTAGQLTSITIVGGIITAYTTL